MRRHHQPHFYDAANAANVPSGVFAAVYVAQLDVAWTQHDVDRMRGVFGIAESGDPGWAVVARCIAVEPGAGNPDQVVAFFAERRRHHHHDGMAYVNLSDWEATERAAIDAGFDPDWWVAHPGDDHPEDLRSPIHGHRPVAVQNYWGPAYDLSVVLGNLPFTPPHEFKASRG